MKFSRITVAPKPAPSLQRGHDNPCRSPGEYGLILIALAQAPELAAALQGVIVKTRPRPARITG